MHNAPGLEIVTCEEMLQSPAIEYSKHTYELSVDVATSNNLDV